MSNPVHRSDARRFIAGIAGVLGAGVVAYVGMTVQTGGELPAKDYTVVSAVFSDVGALKPQNKVTENGLRVGTVTDIQYVDGHAVATLRLDGDVEVHADARAEVRTESALGRKYVALDRGSSADGPLADGRIENTSATSDIDTMLSAFPESARSGLRTTMTEVGVGATGHSADLNAVMHRSPELLNDGRTLLSALNSERADLPELLVTAERLSAGFRGREQDITALMVDADTTLDAVNTGNGEPLGRSVDQLPATLQEAETSLAALRPGLTDLGSASRTLRPVAADLAVAVPDLRGFLREAVPPARKVPGVSAQAVPAVKDLDTLAADNSDLLTDRLPRTLENTGVVLPGLEPYLGDVGDLFENHYLLGGPGSTQGAFHMQLALPGLYNASLPDPTYKKDPYPGPGAAMERQKGLNPK